MKQIGAIVRPALKEYAVREKLSLRPNMLRRSLELIACVLPLIRIILIPLDIVPLTLLTNPRNVAERHRRLIKHLSILTGVVSHARVMIALLIRRPHLLACLLRGLKKKIRNRAILRRVIILVAPCLVNPRIRK